MNKKLIRLTESDLHKIVKATLNNIIKEDIWGDDDYEDDEEMTFDDMENYYLDRSVSYERCEAFRMALAYIKKVDPEYYKKVIEVGYNESFG